MEGRRGTSAPETFPVVKVERILVAVTNAAKTADRAPDHVLARSIKHASATGMTRPPGPSGVAPSCPRVSERAGPRKEALSFPVKTLATDARVGSWTEGRCILSAIALVRLHDRIEDPVNTRLNGVRRVKSGARLKSDCRPPDRRPAIL